MKIALVTNLNGKGLQIDAELLSAWLTERDHSATVVQYDQPLPNEMFDICICLEVVALVPAKRYWYFANPEWLLGSYVRTIQKSFHLVLAKTRDAESVLRERFPAVEHTGFICQDKFDASIKRERKCLHLGGGSGFRNTPAVIEAWRSYRYWDDTELPPLTVVSNSTTVVHQETQGITFIKRATDEEIKHLQNSHLFHVMPSAYEGYGHALHEAQSVGAVLLTTNAGPMAELKSAFTVEPCGTKKNNFAMLQQVSPKDIREAVPKMLAASPSLLFQVDCDSRLAWEFGNECFDGAMEELLKPQSRTSTKPVVAIWGNFDPPHSTENDWVWSFESLGYKVLKFQENKAHTDEILFACIEENVKLFLYIHTHGWESPGALSPGLLIEDLRLEGIKTVSPHLDLYFGLNADDQRDSKVGKHAFFKTDFVMTADGSSQEKFKQRGVNHVWMPPACVARDCVKGEYREELACDVAFVGAKGYHKEYPWRGEMIDTLQDTFGNKFRVLTGFRGQRLNDLYASVKVVVGDCCFSGKPFYWSDRLPETCGRGGFLLFPQIEGMCIPTATFIPQNISDLVGKIDYYLEHEKERELIRQAAHEHVKAHDTYTHRARQIIEVAGLA